MTSRHLRIEPRLGTEADLRELDSTRESDWCLLDLLPIIAPTNTNVSNRPAGEESAVAWFKWKTFPECESFYDVPEMPCPQPELGSRAGAPVEAARYWLRLGRTDFD